MVAYLRRFRDIQILKVDKAFDKAFYALSNLIKHDKASNDKASGALCVALILNEFPKVIER